MSTLFNPAFRERKSERGQTIVFVAISLFALISVAAIAIDLTTLYVARNEAQQAADAIALSGAKAFVSSGFTSGYVDLTTAETLATNQATATAQQLSVGGQTLQTSNLAITFPNTAQSNPVISVTVSRTGLPTFLARIWGVRSTNASATASAEAYNPSGTSSSIQVSAVKPFLLPNCPPASGTGSNASCPGNELYVSSVDGSIVNGGQVGQSITLTLPDQSVLTGPPYYGELPGTNYFYPLDIPVSPPTPFCPSSSLSSCSLLGKGNYFDNIACSNPTLLSCGQLVGGSTSIPIDTRVTSSSNWNQLQSRLDQGTQCLIHASTQGPSNGQDIFSAPTSTGQRILISPGTNNPDPSVSAASYITRSDSIVSIPLFDGRNLCQGASNQNQVCAYAAPVVGFLQLGIQQDDGTGSLDAIILNASGCNPGASGQKVSGGYVSSIPVRLVQSP